MAHPPYPEPAQPVDPLNSLNPLNPGWQGEPPRPPRRPSRVLLAACVAALLTGAWLIHDGRTTSHPPAPGAAEAVTASAAPSAPAGGPVIAPLPYSPPVRIRIPAIRVDAPLMKIGLDADQHLQVPPESEPNLAGWYAEGAAPGSQGAAVIAGHVDTHQGKAVFYDLGAMHKGETVQVLRADGRTAVFTIYGIEVYPKTVFPSSRVYADPPGAEIRVITCGGAFVKGSGYYGNVVVYGRLTAVKQPGAIKQAAPQQSPAATPSAHRHTPSPTATRSPDDQPTATDPTAGQSPAGLPSADQPSAGASTAGASTADADQPEAEQSATATATR